MIEFYPQKAMANTVQFIAKIVQFTPKSLVNTKVGVLSLNSDNGWFYYPLIRPN